MITLDLSILNQKGTPMFYSDIFANRPAAGVVGRIFISTDTYAIYRDTGSAWDQIGGSGSGITGSGTAGTLPIWTASSILGDSSLLEGSTKITTTKDFRADSYYLNGMDLGGGALYHDTFPSSRVTLANYNVGGYTSIEVNGGATATIFGADLSLTNYGYISAIPSLTAANNASSIAAYGQNTLSYAAGFSSNNIGAIYGSIAGVNLQTFAGSATFAQANLASGGVSVNSIDFSSAGSTITMTQSSGIRAMTGNQSQIQYQGTNSATISHAAISQNLGFYRPSGASGTLTITNAYSHLINALDDYGAGFTFTNRWGIYQAGASDTNYFAASTLIGTTVNTGEKLIVGSSGRFTQNQNGITSVIVQNNDLSNGAGQALRFYYNSSSIGGLYHLFDTASSAYNLSLQVWNGFNPVSRLIINGITGNTGIGTSTPSEKLDVSDSGDIKAIIQSTSTGSGANSALAIKTSTEGYWLIQTGNAVSSGLRFYNGSTSSEISRFSSAGNLLLGTNVDAGQKLQVNGTARIFGDTTIGGSGDPYLAITGTAGAYTGILYINAAGGGSSKIYGNGGSNTLTLGTNSIDHITLTPTGNFLIGSNVNQGQKLYLNGSLRIDGQSSGTAGGASGQHLIINLDGTTYKIALLNP